MAPASTDFEHTFVHVPATSPDPVRPKLGRLRTFGPKSACPRSSLTPVNPTCVVLEGAILRSSVDEGYPLVPPKSTRLAKHRLNVDRRRPEFGEHRGGSGQTHRTLVDGETRRTPTKPGRHQSRAANFACMAEVGQNLIDPGQSRTKPADPSAARGQLGRVAPILSMPAHILGQIRLGIGRVRHKFGRVRAMFWPTSVEPAPNVARHWPTSTDIFRPESDQIPPESDQNAGGCDRKRLDVGQRRLASRELGRPSVRDYDRPP